MDCIEVEEHLSSLVDQQLPKDLAAEVEAHLASCPSCRRFLQMEKSAKGVLRTRLARAACPSDTRRRILASIGQADAAASLNLPDEERRPAPLAALRRRFAQSPLAASIVGVGLFVAIFSFVLIKNAVGGRIMPYIEDVHAHHVKCADFPLHENTDDPVRLANWFRQEMGLSATVPDLSSETYLLKGGRSCRLCGHQLALIRYDSAGKGLSLFLVDEDRVPIAKLEKRSRGECDFYVATTDGCSIAFWRCHQVTGALAAEMPLEELLDIAEKAARASKPRFGDMPQGEAGD